MRQHVQATAVLCVLALTTVFCACDTQDDADFKQTESITESESITTAEIITAYEPVFVTLTADFSCGNPDETLGLIKSKVIETESEPTVEELAKALGEWSGLDFSATGRIADANVYVDWSSDSTLVRGLDDREQKEEFFFYDAVSLNRFMLDSLALTISTNLPVQNIFYSMDGGKALVFPNAEEIPSLLPDQAYDSIALFASQRLTGDSDSDSDTPYWNGMNFGPNLEYNEEYKSDSDTGDNPNAAEAAITVFKIMRDGGHISDYSDDKSYTIVFIGIDVVGEAECYIYRMDDGIRCAYSYEQGIVYYEENGWIAVYAG